VNILFDLVRYLFRKSSGNRSAKEAEPEMTGEIETSEHAPWTLERVLGQLDHLHPLDVRDVLATPELSTDRLVGALSERGGKARVNAAALLLLLGDAAGSPPFLAALAGPDGDARKLAIDYVKYAICPHDIDPRGAIVTNCPISSDDIFAALERDLHAPWTGVSAEILEIVARYDFPQSHPFTRPLLAHPDTALRRTIAENYLNAGRDEGAFAVVEHLLRAAPAWVSHRDPAWLDFYPIKRLWHSIEEAALRGDSALREKAASLAMESVGQPLDTPECANRFDTNDGLIDASHACKAIAAAMPHGGKPLLERVIAHQAIDDYYRGETLSAYALALGEEARRTIVSALQDPALRSSAADAFQPLVHSKNLPEDIAVLRSALENEDRPEVIAALARTLLAAGPDGLPAVERVLERSESWARVELSWRVEGGTDRALADLLTEAGVIDPIDDDTLADALNGGLDVRNLIWAGGERMVVFGIKASTGLEHFDLFQNLLQVARPTIAVEDLKETINANLVREPVAGAPRVERVTDLGTVSTISFNHGGREFHFDVHPKGRWHDVAGVMNGFDAFMQAIGRDDRCYELEGGGSEHAMLVVAPASKFEPLVKRLSLPIEHDPANARDAAKAYQLQIQTMRE